MPAACVSPYVLSDELSFSDFLFMIFPIISLNVGTYADSFRYINYINPDAKSVCAAEAECLK